VSDVPKAVPEPVFTPFERARDRITPLCQAYGFRQVLLETPGRGSPHGFCEYTRGSVRLRLVWEGEEKALWLETARHVAGEVVGRWTDVEWDIAGERVPLDQDVGDSRLDRLELVLAAFVLQSFPGSRPG